MEKRLIVAIALSILIIVSFQYLFVKPQPQQSPPVMTQEKGPAIEAVKTVEPATGPAVRPAAEEKELNVETEKYIVTFSDVGGSIKGIALKDYEDLKTGKPLDLVSLYDPKEYLLAIHNPLSTIPYDALAYTPSKKDGVITYKLRTDKFEITKNYFFPNSKYAIELQLSVKNLTNSPQAFTCRIIGGAGIIEPSLHDRRMVESTSKVNAKFISYRKPKAGRIINPGIVGWTALKNKYFSLILKPLVNTNSQFYSESREGTPITGIEAKEVVIPANSFAEFKFILYAGPSRIQELKAVDPELEETINYGFFGFISKAMVTIMSVLHMLVKSWGVSIILLSIFLNLILFPLTAKSFTSMQKMQALHPEMEKLKVQYKGNPQKLNKEIMELYKKYNINPLSGCLPLLLQMPIFFALYQALMKSVELRSASFLWIKDLSSPDAVSLPFTLPLIGNSINILPILMVIGMVVQQKISTKVMGGAVTDEQKQTQQMMLVVMPIVFGFIFYSMPSGLVLYWLVNTILTIIEQSFIFKKA